MGRSVKLLQNYTTAQVKQIIKSNSDYYIDKKLCAILQVNLGKSSRFLAPYYCVSPKQIRNWVARFDAEGIEGLRIKKGRGRRSFISPEQMEQVKSDLSRPPEFFGYNSGVWTGPLLQKHLEKSYQIFYKISTIYDLLYRLGFSFLRPRSKYPERDEAKREVAKIDIKNFRIL
jgi:transposase